MEIEFEPLNALVTSAQVIVPIIMLAWPLPRREPKVRVTILAVLLYLVWTTVLGFLAPHTDEANQMVFSTVLYACALVFSGAIVMLLFQTSPWAAIFCATAGYTLQNLAGDVGGLVNVLIPQIGTLPIAQFFFMVVPYVVTYLLAYPLFIKRIEREGLELMRPQPMLAMMVAVILGVIAYDVVIKQIQETDIETWMYVVVRLSHMALCVMVLVLEYEMLYARHLSHEVTALTQTMAAEQEQYQVSKETIDAINIKCHDIRHQIRQLGEQSGSVDPAVLDDIEREVDVYDAAVRTGFEPLDVILTEKSLLCEGEGITLTCMADGPCLSFMAAADVYSLMGNALDNAIEAVRGVEDPERRSVSVLIRRSGGMALIHVENYFEGERTFKDGLPQTTKADKDSHGYGTRSMRLVCQRYGGTLHMRTEGDVFHLNAALPIPQTKAEPAPQPA